MLFYLAYGSNLHRLRLADRVPSAKLVGAAQLPGRRIAFHKLSTDGSGKANLLESGREEDVAWGAVYQLAPAHVARLDKAEGLGNGYNRSRIVVHLDQAQYECFTYQAANSHIDDSLRPYHWYKEFVLAGARYLSLPQCYIDSLARVESIDDPLEDRAASNGDFLERMRRMPSAIAGKC